MEKRIERDEKSWSKISFLTLRFDNFCNSVLKSHHTLIHPAHKVICLARSGDWNAAALSLATYSSINAIESDYEKLLIKLSHTKESTDNFFDNVVVNDENQDIKNNRLELLKMFCNTFDNFIDFSKLEGL